MWYLYLNAVTSRFKTYKKYVYQYTTESRNGVVGAASLRNGPRVSCQVHSCLCVVQNVLVWCPFLLNWPRLCCRVSAGRDRSPPSMWICHAHQWLYSEWGVGHGSPGPARVHEGPRLRGLQGRHGKVSQNNTLIWFTCNNIMCLL